MVPNIEIIVGTYEEFLLGYKFDLKDEKPVLVQSFADKSHSGSIKSLAVQGHWIATGSTDDRIFVYNMRTRKQTEIILSHEGTVNALTFSPDNTYLFSGGDDGRMIATHVGNWVTNAAWKKAHDGKSVTHISCHPSGKLALTLGSDLILRTWNLVKGRVAYKTNLKSRTSLGHVADCIAWSPTGDYFSLIGQRIIEIWSIQKADVVRSQKTSSKPTSVCWINNENHECIVGLEDGKIIWFNLNEDEKEVLIDAHETRVKAMTLHEDTLVTVSSSGEIKVWQLNATEKSLTEITAINIGCRPTCLGILDLEQFGTNYTLDTNVTETKEFETKIEKKPAGNRGIVTIEYENEDEAEPVKEKSNQKKALSSVDNDDDDSEEDDGDVDGDDDEDKDDDEDEDDDDEDDENDDEEDNSSDSAAESSEEEQVVQKKKRKIDQHNSKSLQTPKQTKLNKKVEQNAGSKIKKNDNVMKQKRK